MKTSDRISSAFAAGREASQPLVVPFITAGYPTATSTVPIVTALAASGADMIEIGMPFSDPLADGPTIQHASEVALRNGMTVGKTLEAVREIRASGTDAALILMGYCNPVFAYGVDAFIKDATQVGVDGLIIADMPPDEAGEFLVSCRAVGLSLTFLVAPNAPDDRIRKVDGASTHFSYCVSVTGVTGARSAIESRTIEFLQRMRKLSTKPFVVGFGIKKPEHVMTLGPHADGVVVGSAIIDAIESVGGAGAVVVDAVNAVSTLVAPLCAAARQATMTAQRREA
ncbi:MAG TPA: tryptophan synthase subunit alpha [Acidobacteriota bacterium]|mgnify:CR=1 FL=1|nr:tryptophan synthase subunit alpha [Acidobacteriota bacterium]HJO30019.1 tryptophan synthase subunit alpha [Acidobacteriota bacterium]